MNVNRDPIEIVYRNTAREMVSVMAVGSPSSMYAHGIETHDLVLADGSRLTINDKGLTKKMRRRISELHGRPYLYKIADAEEIVLTPWDEDTHDGIRDYEVGGLPKDTVQLWSLNTLRDMQYKPGEKWLHDMDNDKVWLIQTKRGVVLHTMNNQEIEVRNPDFHKALAKLFCGQKLRIRKYVVTRTAQDTFLNTEPIPTADKRA